MQTIHYFEEKSTVVYQSGRYKEAREATPLTLAAKAAAEKWPEITSRVWKAVTMYEDGLVILIPEAEQVMSQHELFTSIHVATVRSKASDPGYAVRRIYWAEPVPGQPTPNRSHKFTCECFDYQKGQSPIIHGQPQCKHIIATKLAMKKMEEAAAAKTQLDTMAATEAETDHQSAKDKAVIEAAKAKTQRRYKGQLYEMANQQIDRRQWEMQQSAS